MQSRELSNNYRLTVSEMSRKSQLAISTWFNSWFAGGSNILTKLQTVSEISTQIILHSRLTLYKGSERCENGTYVIDDEITLALPLTETGLNDQPASLVAWLIDAAGRENAVTLEGFLASVRVMSARMTTTFERLSDNGRFTNQTPL